MDENNAHPDRHEHDPVAKAEAEELFRALTDARDTLIEDITQNGGRRLELERKRRARGAQASGTHSAGPHSRTVPPKLRLTPSRSVVRLVVERGSPPRRSEPVDVVVVAGQGPTAVQQPHATVCVLTAVTARGPRTVVSYNVAPRLDLPVGDHRETLDFGVPGAPAEVVIEVSVVAPKPATLRVTPYRVTWIVRNGRAVNTNPVTVVASHDPLDSSRVAIATREGAFWRLDDHATHAPGIGVNRYVFVPRIAPRKLRPGKQVDTVSIDGNQRVDVQVELLVEETRSRARRFLDRTAPVGLLLILALLAVAAWTTWDAFYQPGMGVSGDVELPGPLIAPAVDGEHAWAVVRTGVAQAASAQLVRADEQGQLEVTSVAAIVPLLRETAWRLAIAANAENVWLLDARGAIRELLVDGTVQNASRPKTQLGLSAGTNRRVFLEHAYGYLWASGNARQRGPGFVYRIDPDTYATRRIRVPCPGPPQAADGKVWVLSHCREHQGMTRIDVETLSQDFMLSFDVGLFAQVAVTAGSLWFNSDDSQLLSYQLRAWKREARSPIYRDVVGVAVADGQLWVLLTSGDVARIDPQSGGRLRTIDLPATGGTLASGSNGFWVLYDRSVIHIGR